MRFGKALLGDIRYQVKYGFYFLYAFISILYIVILRLCPADYTQRVASVIILTDPATLGMFFIGGIWLLEKGEGIHGFWSISPLKAVEYVLSKAVSMAAISTISAVIIALAGLGRQINFLLLAVSVFIGSMIFTMLGLYFASFAKSVNHYMMIVAPIAIILALPPILAVFGYSHLILDILPGMALWRIIVVALGSGSISMLWFLVLVSWFAISLFLVTTHIPAAMTTEVGVQS